MLRTSLVTFISILTVIGGSFLIGTHQALADIIHEDINIGLTDVTPGSSPTSAELTFALVGGTTEPIEIRAVFFDDLSLGVPFASTDILYSFSGTGAPPAGGETLETGEITGLSTTTATYVGLEYREFGSATWDFVYHPTASSYPVSTFTTPSVAAFLPDGTILGSPGTGAAVAIAGATATPISESSFSVSGGIDTDSEIITLELAWGIDEVLSNATEIGTYSTTPGSYTPFEVTVDGLTETGWYYYQIQNRDTGEAYGGITLAGQFGDDIDPSAPSPVTGGSSGRGSGTEGSGAFALSRTQVTKTCSEIGEDDYCLLSPLPTIEKFGQITDAEESDGIIATNTLGGYFNAVIQFAIGLLGVIAVLVIIGAGITLMSTDSVTKTDNAKHMITNALGGLALAIGSFLILYTLNPDLTIIRIGNLQPISIEGSDFDGIATLDSSFFELITGESVLSPSEYDEMAREVAIEQGIEYCVMKAILQKETPNTDPRAIGQDENVSGTRSHSAFLSSGITYLGEAIPSIKKNDAPANPAAGDLTLNVDWRFSKGIGLMQITFFPTSYNDPDYTSNPPAYEQRFVVPTRTIGGTTYEPHQLLDPKTNLEAGAKIWKGFYTGSSACAGDIQSSFAAYNGGTGACTASSGRAYAYSVDAMGLYNQCLDEE